MEGRDFRVVFFVVGEVEEVGGRFLFFRLFGETDKTDGIYRRGIC